MAATYLQPDRGIDPADYAEHCDLEQLATEHGTDLRLDHDREAPLPYAVWCSSPDSPDEIIGAGHTAVEAIDEAGRQLEIWERAS